LTAIVTETRIDICAENIITLINVLASSIGTNTVTHIRDTYKCHTGDRAITGLGIGI